MFCCRVDEVACVKVGDEDEVRRRLLLSLQEALPSREFLVLVLEVSESKSGRVGVSLRIYLIYVNGRYDLF